LFKHATAKLKILGYRLFVDPELTLFLFRYYLHLESRYVHSLHLEEASGIHLATRESVVNRTGSAVNLIFRWIYNTSIIQGCIEFTVLLEGAPEYLWLLRNLEGHRIVSTVHLVAA